jgi:hypothetical protein
MAGAFSWGDCPEAEGLCSKWATTAQTSFNFVNANVMNFEQNAAAGLIKFS